MDFNDQLPFFLTTGVCLPMIALAAMHLTQIQIWNFRSFCTEDDSVPAAELKLQSGANFIVGPNNAGKSNLLRALAWALDPNAPFSEELDRSQQSQWGPAVVLEFSLGPNPRPDINRLYESVLAYEQCVSGFQAPGPAAERKIRFYVEINKGVREEWFLHGDSWEKATGASATTKRKKALERFHALVRYVDIQSGEDLQSLLRRGFKAILASALGDEHGKAMKVAENARLAYIEALGHVLRPIAKHAEDRLHAYVRDVQEVDLQARLPSVEDAVADAALYIRDAVMTPLDQKGTGVRGAVLLLLMSFIADSSKNVVVFGIEEPEAFLHPEAHRELGIGLDRFTMREDVSLLVTTHSPFLFRTGEDGWSRVFLVKKNAEGRSSVQVDKGREARVDLMGSQGLASILERAEEVPEGARMILIVEGKTDQGYLELASKHLGISLGDVHILPRGSAAGAALQAVTVAARHAPGRKVVALFDSDEPGTEAYTLLSKRFGWKDKGGEGLYAWMYSQWVVASEVPVEAEDMFSSATLEAFLAGPGHGDYCDEKKRRKNGAWHYGFTQEGKKKLVEWLGKYGTAEMFEGWTPVLSALRGVIDGIGGGKK